MRTPATERHQTAPTRSRRSAGATARTLRQKRRCRAAAGAGFGVAHQQVSDDADPDVVQRADRPLAGDSEPLVQVAVAATSAGHAVAFVTGEPYSARPRRAGFNAFHAEPDEGSGRSGRLVRSASVNSVPEFVGSSA